MARNGSGNYSVPNTFVAGTTITASDHNENWSDLATEMSNSVAADGQTSMTGALKLTSGTASAPGVVFSADTNTGMYRIGSDNLGFAVGGTKIVDVSASGISITGTITQTGAFTAGDGAVGAPGISFTSDPDSGVYRIGANNIGIAVNGAKVLDVGTAGLGVTGTLTSSGAMTVAAGGLTVTAGGLTVTAGAVSLPAGAIATAALTDAPARVFIKTQTASSSSSLDFVNGTDGVVFDDTYDFYEFVITGLTAATDSVSLTVRVGTGAGPTYQSANYRWTNGAAFDSSPFTAAEGSASDSAIHISSTTANIKFGNDAGYLMDGVVRVGNPEATGYKLIKGYTVYRSDNDLLTRADGGGTYTGSTAALTAIRFLMSSGNIASGRITLYGYRKS